ncbi:unnamed protein product [Closterium sp. Yama58-4]|nr:unnamed protein product [Closterium sp. Yama58-4]
MTYRRIVSCESALRSKSSFSPTKRSTLLLSPSARSARARFRHARRRSSVGALRFREWSLHLPPNFVRWWRMPADVTAWHHTLGTQVPSDTASTSDTASNTLDTTTNADSAGTATSVDATAGASGSDLAALAVDAKTRAEIKALAPLLGSADLTGADKPPERASYLTKDAFAAAARQWLAKVKRRVEKLIRQAGGGGGTGRGASNGNSARRNTTTVGESRAGALLVRVARGQHEGGTRVARAGHVGGTPPSGARASHHQGPRQAACACTNPSYLPLLSLFSPSSLPLLSLFSPSSLPTPPLLPPPDRRLGYVPPPSTDPAKQPNLNTVSRYLTVGLKVDPTSQKLTWDFKKNVDHSKLFTPDDEFDQGNCGSCWAYAAARAVQGAYAKLKETDDDVFPSGMRLSVQQLLDCTGAAASCRGGYPEAALQYAAKIGLQDEAEYAYTGASGRCSVNKDADKWNISMYEQVPLPGPLGLILALQKQPVIVTIRASSQDFIDYSGGWGCYNPVGTVLDSGGSEGFRATATATNNTGLLDHVMLAVGYNYEGPSNWNNYFILKNSWGPQWGEGGYMRIRMENGPFGTCGMLVNRGLYPVVNDESGNGKYTCQCTDLLVPAVNRDGTPTCTIVDICSVLPTNPCVVGQCINSGDGGYSCLCPPNYKPSTLASGQITCVPDMATSAAAAVQGTYTVQGGETCGSIYGFIGLSQEQFLEQNKICIQVGDAVSGAADYNLCTSYVTASEGITCSLPNLPPLKPCLSNLLPLSHPLQICIQICIQVGDAVSGVADYNLCTSYVAASEWITCANAVDWYGLSWFDLYRLNPGLNCDTIGSLTGSEICIAGTPLGAVACGKARSRKVANRKYTVAAGDSCASLVVVQFQRQPPLMSELNRGWMCRSQSLFQGMPLCIPS